MVASFSKGAQFSFCLVVIGLADLAGPIDLAGHDQEAEGKTGLDRDYDREVEEGIGLGREVEGGTSHDHDHD